MVQFYQINNTIHDLNLIIIITSVIDTITHQIEILINATYQLSVELVIVFGLVFRVIRLIVVFVFDPRTVEYEFLITIRGWTTMRIEFCNGITIIFDDPIGSITIRIFNGMFSAINILIKVSILVLFFDALTIIFSGIGLNFDKLCEIECNSNTTRLVNNPSINTINNDAAVVINIGFFVVAVCFVMQVMDRSLLITRLSIKCDTNMVAIAQLKTKLAVQSSNGAVNCHTHVIHNVCGVFYYFFQNLYFFQFINVILLLNAMGKKYTT